MNRRNVLFAALAILAIGSTADAILFEWNEGRWPKSWPKELEPLRKQARTATGPCISDSRYTILFGNRESFESVWLHLLEVKSKGSPIILVRALDETHSALRSPGVCIHAPTPEVPRSKPEEPLTGEMSVRERWRYTTFIELIVDGDIVDLNRIRLPEDTPIVDERFQDGGRNRSAGE